VRIYISGIQSSNIDDCATYNATYIPREQFLSNLVDATRNEVFIWAYSVPWGNAGYISRENLDKWNNDQLSILSNIKKTKKKVILFNESLYSTAYVLSSISGETCNEKPEPPTKRSQYHSDKLYFGLLSVWGKKYLNTLDRLEKSSLNYNKNSSQNKKKAYSSTEHLELWLSFIEKARENQNSIDKLNEDLRKRFTELAKLTILQEEKTKNYEVQLNKLNEEISTLKSKKEQSINDESFNEKGDYSLTEQIQESKSHIELLNKEISLQKETILYSHKKIDLLTKELNGCKQSLDDRFNELAVITGMLELSKRENLKLIEELNLQTQKKPSNKENLSWKMKSPLTGIRNKFGSKKKKAQHIKKSIELIKQSPLFDETWYLQQNLDVQESKIDPARHYYLFGGFENRDPSSNFSSQGYLDLYADVRESRMNPLEHYIRYGESEHRIIKSGKYLNN